MNYCSELSCDNREPCARHQPAPEPGAPPRAETADQGGPLREQVAALTERVSKLEAIIRRITKESKRYEVELSDGSYLNLNSMLFGLYAQSE